MSLLLKNIRIYIIGIIEKDKHDLLDLLQFKSHKYMFIILIKIIISYKISFIFYTR